ncbi:hypothetical protein HDC90_000480 [Pedobacter sp. AK013]|uniref:hypothetical protein n=1 Tax=Pedobacter sp. AK013 TaxID=2723071 RepID=UPI0016086144|nr:hypothetical protein [Pedobacter sp. AK013]MBB6235880.1 hypothetical protein [Pedobacter sp. AK013]
MIRSIKNVLLFNILMVMSCTSFAQKQTFDVVAYTLPKGWQEKKSEAGIQLSSTDTKTSAYAVVVITKSMVSSLTASENFNNDWLKLVKGTVQINGEPTIQNPTKENGWDIISGNANYTDGANNGIATLLTATGGNKVVSVVSMTNSKQYQNDLSTFLSSLELSKAVLGSKSYTNTVATDGVRTNAITGIWGQYQNENFSTAGGGRQATAGYDWREYYLNTNGTYQFLQKNISYLYNNNIVIAYEKGGYKINGNQIEIVPKSGIVEVWSKGNSDKAGKLLKTEKRKLEKISYTFTLHYFSAIREINLVLQYATTTTTTTRDGAFSSNNLFPNAWYYKRPFNPNKRSIELPEGTSIRFENNIDTAP